MLGGEQSNHRARLGIFREGLQGFGDGGEEAAVGAAQHEAQAGAGLERRVGSAGVVERPRAELIHEIAGKCRIRRAFGAGQQDHHGRAVGQAIVEQLTREGVVLGVACQLAHVFGGAQGADAGARATRELLHQLGRHRSVEQLLLALS